MLVISPVIALELSFTGEAMPNIGRSSLGLLNTLLAENTRKLYTYLKNEIEINGNDQYASMRMTTHYVFITKNLQRCCWKVTLMNFQVKKSFESRAIPF
jgi:hypothetical protein